MSCSICGSDYHSSVTCFQKRRKPIKSKSDKTATKDLAFKGAWLQANPGDIERGKWECYLQISELCPKILTIETLTREHVKPKGTNKSLKYQISNVRPACTWCNAIKSSRTLENLAKEYPHLEKYLD